MTAATPLLIARAPDPDSAAALDQRTNPPGLISHLFSFAAGAAAGVAVGLNVKRYGGAPLDPLDRKYQRLMYQDWVTLLKKKPPAEKENKQHRDCMEFCLRSNVRETKREQVREATKAGGLPQKIAALPQKLGGGPISLRLLLAFWEKCAGSGDGSCNLDGSSYYHSSPNLQSMPLLRAVAVSPHPLAVPDTTEAAVVAVPRTPGLGKDPNDPRPKDPRPLKAALVPNAWPARWMHRFAQTMAALGRTAGAAERSAGAAHRHSASPKWADEEFAVRILPR
ncbi:MAG: hypothetical protein M1826_004327 [Phylliscum demangeonii]|nr:MAG: hypothetical protein M1826_004327 [Phylliscum demangeonii]